MIIRKTEIYEKWFKKLKDNNAKNIINKRLLKIKIENHLGDIKPVGDKIFEIRIDYGSGYRIYYLQENNFIILLLIGGDKSTQDEDIKKAKKIIKEL
jgi:putative addiction module killer protein